MRSAVIKNIFGFSSSGKTAWKNFQNGTSPRYAVRFSVRENWIISIERSFPGQGLLRCDITQSARLVYTSKCVTLTAFFGPGKGWGFAGYNPNKIVANERKKMAGKNEQGAFKTRSESNLRKRVVLFRFAPLKRYVRTKFVSDYFGFGIGLKLRFVYIQKQNLFVKISSRLLIANFRSSKEILFNF